ncbi:small stress response protein [Escherichia coli]|nr:small stress response protein [Escherichia coli]
MDLHQMLLIHDILHCKEMSKMKDVDQIFDALDCHILREYLIYCFMINEVPSFVIYFSLPCTMHYCSVTNAQNKSMLTLL